MMKVSFKNYSKTFKKKMVKLWNKNKTKSMSKFCKDQGISPRSLKRWIEAYPRPPEKVSKDKTKPQESSEYRFIISEDSLVISLGKDSRVLVKSAGNFRVVVDKLISGQFEEAWTLCDTRSMISKFSNGVVSVEGSTVKVSGVVIDNSMSKKLIEMVNKGEEGVEAFAEFMKRLLINSDERVIKELYNFLKHTDIELNSDGSFFGYKAVTSEYFDKRTGKIDNSIGAIPLMPRSAVNADSTVTCSTGLHVGSLQYAKDFASKGDYIVKVKVFPEDVVSVPVDYDGQKLRSCRYEVVEHLFEKGDYSQCL